MTLLVPAAEEGLLTELGEFGFERVYTFRRRSARVLAAVGEARLSFDVHAMHYGWRECESEGCWLDHAAVREHMDPRDVGLEPVGPPGRKAAISWTPVERGGTHWPWAKACPRRSSA